MCTVLNVYKLFFSFSFFYHQQKVVRRLAPTGLGIEDAGVDERPRHLKYYFLLGPTWCQTTRREEDKNMRTHTVSMWALKITADIIVKLGKKTNWCYNKNKSVFMCHLIFKLRIKYIFNTTNYLGGKVIIKIQNTCNCFPNVFHLNFVQFCLWLFTITIY